MALGLLEGGAPLLPPRLEYDIIVHMPDITMRHQRDVMIYMGDSTLCVFADSVVLGGFSMRSRPPSGVRSPRRHP